MVWLQSRWLDRGCCMVDSMLTWVFAEYFGCFVACFTETFCVAGNDAVFFSRRYYQDLSRLHVVWVVYVGFVFLIDVNPIIFVAEKAFGNVVNQIASTDCVGCYFRGCRNGFCNLFRCVCRLCCCRCGVGGSCHGRRVGCNH